MPAGPGNDLGGAVAADKCFSNDKTRAKRTRGGLGRNAHAIIDPFSIRLKCACSHRSVSQADRQVS